MYGLGNRSKVVNVKVKFQNIEMNGEMMKSDQKGFGLKTVKRNRTARLRNTRMDVENLIYTM